VSVPEHILKLAEKVHMQGQIVPHLKDGNYTEALTIISEEGRNLAVELSSRKGSPPFSFDALLPTETIDEDELYLKDLQNLRAALTKEKR
jgi:hypothetical protein